MIFAGIVAGGTGNRIGADIPKQFLDLDGKPIIIHTAQKFLSHPLVDKLIIGVHPDWTEHMEELNRKYLNSAALITPGGAERNDTIVRIIRCAFANGGEMEDILLTHDAVRPFVTERMITDSINAMDTCEICTTAVPATDTIVVSEDGESVSDFPLRKTMFCVQTPQTFKMQRFLEMLSLVPEEERALITDACKLFHMNGITVRLIKGDASNIKITYPSDLKKC